MNGIALLAVGAIACAACGDPGGSAAQPTAPSPPTTAPAPEPATPAVDPDESGEAVETTSEIAMTEPDDDEAVEPATEEVEVEERPDDDPFGGLPDTVDAWLDFMGDDMITGLGGTECATDLARLLVAAVAHSGFDGPEPESLDELEPYLDRPIELWTLTPDDDTPQPAPGSGCSAAGFDVEPAGSFPESTPEPEPTGEPDCLRIEERTLETAIEAHYAEHGTWPTSDQQLVDEGYLRVAFEAFDVGKNGTIIEIPGAPCTTD